MDQQFRPPRDTGRATGRQAQGRRDQPTSTATSQTSASSDHASTTTAREKQRAEQGDEATSPTERPPRPEPPAPEVEQPLAPDQVAKELVSLGESYAKVSESVNVLQKQLGEKDESIAQMKGHLTYIAMHLAITEAANQAQKPVVPSTLQEIADAIVRVTVITLLGGVIGGPLLAQATNSLLGPKIIESTVASFVAAASAEVATRATSQTDPADFDYVSLYTREPTSDADISQAYIRQEPPKRSRPPSNFEVRDDVDD
jgi:hypothetical protein